MEFIRDASEKSYEEIHSLGVDEAEKLFRRIYDDLLGDIKSQNRMSCSNAYICLKRIKEKRKPVAK